MRLLTGTVQGGMIRLDDTNSLPDGTCVTVVVEDDEPVEDGTLDEVPVLGIDERDNSDDRATLEEIAVLSAVMPPRRSRVLVIEDDPEMRDAFSEVLEAAGYRVHRARDGAEAMRYLQDTRSRPHVILLDARMPNMDGFQFRLAQAARPELAYIPVVLTSAFRDIRKRVEGLNVAAFLPKPVAGAELVATISRLCATDDG